MPSEGKYRRLSWALSKWACELQSMANLKESTKFMKLSSMMSKMSMPSEGKIHEIVMNTVKMHIRNSICGPFERAPLYMRVSWTMSKWACELQFKDHLWEHQIHDTVMNDVRHDHAKWGKHTWDCHEHCQNEHVTIHGSFEGAPNTWDRLEWCQYMKITSLSFSSFR